MALSRDLIARIDADPAGFNRGMKSAEASAKAFEKELAKQEAQLMKHHQAIAKLGALTMGAGAAMVGAFTLAEHAVMSFDKEMSKVAAATNTTGAAFKALREAAIKTGADTQYSAVEAAAAETALAKAGLSVKEILGGGLKGATDLAAAGQLEVGQAAEIAATAMTQFGLSGKDVPHIADLLAAAAGKAQGEVTDMATALKYVGPVAHQMGVSIEETSGTIALLASNGILADQAGTSLRGMLTALTSPSKLAAKTMGELGINMYDTRGAFVGFDGIAGQLHTTLGKLTARQRDVALGQIFGNEQITAARILYAGGAADVDKWTKAVDQQGYAGAQAAKLMDNLSGDLEKLKGSLNTALVEGGSSASGALRGLTQAATETVNAYSALPHWLQSTATILGAVTGAATLAGGAFMMGAPKVLAFKDSIKDMGPRSAGIAKGLVAAGNVLTGPWGLAIAGGVVAAGLFAHAKAEAAARVEEFTRAIVADSGVIGENTRKTAVATLEKQGLLKSAQNLGLSLQDVTAAALGNADAMARVDGALDDMRGTTTMSAKEINTYGTVVAANAGPLNIFREKLGGVAAATEGGVAAAKRQSEALGESAGKTGAVTSAQGLLAGATADTNGEIQAQVKSLKDLLAAQQAEADKVLGLRDANRGYQAAIDNAAKALHETKKGLISHGQALDVNTEKGRANSAALDDIAKAAGTVLKDLVENGAGTERVTKTFHAQEKQLIAVGMQFGMTRDQAKQYADSVLRIPKATETKVKADTAPVSAKLAALQTQLDRLDGRTVDAQVNLTVNGINTLQGVQNKLAVIDRAHADGGLIRGPGTGTSDSIPAMLSNGEYVLTAGAVNAIGTPALDRLNKARSHDVAYFAGGGLAGTLALASGGRPADPASIPRPPR